MQHIHKCHCHYHKEELSSMFFSVFKLVKRKLNLRDQIYNLTIGQIEILYFIKNKKQVLMKDIAEFLNITPPSATSLINNLVLNDILERKCDKDDRRMVWLSLTNKGEVIFEKAKKERIKIFENIIANLTLEEKNTFLNILKKIQS